MNAPVPNNSKVTTYTVAPKSSSEMSKHAFVEDLIKNGFSDEEIMHETGSLWSKSLLQFRRAHLASQSRGSTPTVVTWIYGRPGCGKMEIVRHHLEGTSAYNWCEFHNGRLSGYKGAPTVVLDMAKSTNVTSSHLARLFGVEQGMTMLQTGEIEVRPERLIVVSYWEPYEYLKRNVLSDELYGRIDFIERTVAM